MYALDHKIGQIDPDGLFISEITLAELKFGVAQSNHAKRNSKVLNDFLTGCRFSLLWIVLTLYAEDKTSTWRQSGR